MYELIFIIIGIIAFLGLTGITLIMIVSKKKKEKKAIEPNYQVFFSLGMIWFPVGVVFMIAVNPGLGVAFICLGLVYMFIGLANRDKWKYPKK